MTKSDREVIEEQRKEIVELKAHIELLKLIREIPTVSEEVWLEFMNNKEFAGIIIGQKGA